MFAGRWARACPDRRRHALRRRRSGACVPLPARWRADALAGRTSLAVAGARFAGVALTFFATFLNARSSRLSASHTTRLPMRGTMSARICSGSKSAPLRRIGAAASGIGPSLVVANGTPSTSVKLTPGASICHRPGFVLETDPPMSGSTTSARNAPPADVEITVSVVSRAIPRTCTLSCGSRANSAAASRNGASDHRRTFTARAISRLSSFSFRSARLS